MKLFNFLIVISIIFLLTTITYAQQQRQKSDESHSLKQSASPAKSEPIQKKNDTQKVSVKKPDQRKSEQDSISKNELSQSQLLGLNLVRGAAFDAISLRDKRQSALIQARAADLLWSYDELVAKELFGSAFESGTNYCLDGKESDQGKISKNNIDIDRSGVLLEIIRLINKHDAGLASVYADKYIDIKNKMPTTSSPSVAKATESMNRLLGDKQSAASGLWRAALSILDIGTDTKLSIGIAERALALALTPEAIIYMRQLADKDRQSADQFYAQALKRMRNDRIPSPGQLTILADYPFSTGMVRLIDGQSNLGVRYPVSANTALNPELINQFLATAYIVLMQVAALGDPQQPDNLSRLNTAFYLAKYLEPKVLKFQPGLLDQWKMLTLQLTPTSGEKVRQNLETSAEQDALPREQRQYNPQQDDVNNILERAEKSTNNSQRDFLYGQAALSATRAGEFEKAREIAGKLANLSIRRRLNSWISFSEAEQALKSKKWDEARNYATEVEVVDERSYLFLELATAIQKEGKGKDTGMVTMLLEEAFSLALASDSTPRKVKVLIGVSNGFAESDFVRSYEVLQIALNTANQLPSESELVFSDTNFIRVLDLGRGPITESKAVGGGDLGKTIVNLAKHDSERSLSLLNTLTNLPLRCSATLTLADYLLHSAMEHKDKLRSEK